MTALVLAPDALARAKRVIRDLLPSYGSSHVSEALAAAVGHLTHASLRTTIQTSSTGPARVETVSGDAFAARLAELTGAPVPDDVAHVFTRIAAIDAAPGAIVRTWDRGYGPIQYSSRRARAWRNVMVAAVNAGIERGLFSVLPGGNHWPERAKEARYGRGSGFVYDFTFDGDVPGIAWVGDARWDELSIHAALWPKPDAAKWMHGSNADFHAGEVWANSWLERRAGAFLQSGRSVAKSLRCRKHRVERVASAQVLPRGYGDRGGIIM